MLELGPRDRWHFAVAGPPWLGIPTWAWHRNHAEAQFCECQGVLEALRLHPVTHGAG